MSKFRTVFSSIGYVQVLCMIIFGYLLYKLVPVMNHVWGEELQTKYTLRRLQFSQPCYWRLKHSGHYVVSTSKQLHMVQRVVVPSSSWPTNPIRGLLHAETVDISTYHPTRNNTAENVNLHVSTTCSFLCFLLLITAGATFTDCIRNTWYYLSRPKKCTWNSTKMSSIWFDLIWFVQGCGKLWSNIKYCLQNV
jgi:hypothetical protein